MASGDRTVLSLKQRQIHVMGRYHRQVDTWRPGTPRPDADRFFIGTAIWGMELINVVR